MLCRLSFAFSRDVLFSPKSLFSDVCCAKEKNMHLGENRTNHRNWWAPPPVKSKALFDDARYFRYDESSYRGALEV